MSNSNTDTRIVEMQFDNKEFEKNAKTSMETLAELKKSLNFDESVKSLQELEKATDSVSFDAIKNSLDSLTEQFSVKATVIRTLTVGVVKHVMDGVNKINRAFHSITIDPVKSGFSEYETQINAVQTILANTSEAMDKAGYSEQERLDLVNEKLDELNHYADKTIYNFTEMTQNIGRFTAAGIDLETSTTAIQGIANLAAVSGSTSQQASTAMYQLSQALSSGTLKLMDWNSVVNAGMGGTVFQNALKETAKAMGTDVDALIAKNGSFRESLQEGWITAEVLTTTLEHFSWDFVELAENTQKTTEEIDAMRQAYIDEGHTLDEANAYIEKTTNLTVEQVKEMKKAELISQGYSEETADSIIAMADTATDAATKVKTFTQLIDTLKESLQSGWTQTWEYIIGDFGEAKALFTDISDYFGDIINASSDARNEIVKAWVDAGGRQDLIDTLWNVIYAIQNIAGGAKDLLSKIFPPVTANTLKSISGALKGVTGWILSATESVGAFFDMVGGSVSGFFAKIADALRKYDEGGVLDKTKFIDNLVLKIKGFQQTVKGVWSWLKGVFEGVRKAFRQNDTEKAEDALNVYDSFVNRIAEMRSAVSGAWASIRGIFSGIGSAFSTWIEPIIGSVKSFFADGSATDWLVNLLSYIPAGITKIANLAKGLGEAVQNSQILQKAGGVIQKGLSGIKTAFTSFVSWLKGLDFSGGEGLLGKIFSAIFGKKSSELDKYGRMSATAGGEAIQVGAGFGMLNMISSAISAIGQRISNFFKQFKGIKLNTEALVKAWNDFTTWLSATATSVGGWISEKGKTIWAFLKSVPWLDIVDKVTSILTKFKILAIVKDLLKIVKEAKGLVSIGSGLSDISKGLSEIGSGFVKIGESVNGIGDILKNISKNGLKIIHKQQDSFGTTLLKIAASIAILVGSLYVLSKIPAEDTKRGLECLGILAAGLVAMSLVLKGINFDGKQLLMMAGSLALMIIPIYALAKMKTETIAKGLFCLSLVFGELAIFTRLAGKGSQYKTQFLSIAIALNLLVLAVNNLGNMKAGKAAKGILALGFVMLELAVFTKLMGNGSQFKTQFLSMAIAINLLVFAVKGLAKMTGGELTKSLIALGVLLTEMGIYIRATNGMKVGGLIGFAVGLLAVSLAMRSLARMKFGSIVKSLLAILGIVMIFKEFTKAASLASATQVIVSLLGFFILVLGFAEVASRIQNMNMLPMLELMTAMAIGMLSMVAAVKMMSAIPTAGVIAGLANIGIILACVGTVMAGLGWIVDWLQSGNIDLIYYLNKGAELMAAIGNTIHQFIVGLIFGTDDAEESETLTQKVTNFVTGLTPLIEAIKGLPEDSGTAMERFASIVKRMVGAVMAVSIGDLYVSFNEWLSGLFGAEDNTDAFDRMGAKVGKLITIITDFSKSMSGFTEFKQSDVTNATKALNGIVNLMAAVEDRSIFDQILTNALGFDKYDVAIAQMPKLGKLLTAFAENVTGFNSIGNTGDTSAALRAATGIADLMNALPEVGGVKSLLFGWKDLTYYATSLSNLSGALKTYATKISGFSTTVSEADVTNSTNAASGIVSLLNALPETGGLWQKIAGWKDLGTFSEDLGPFADGLNAYADVIAGWSTKIRGADENGQNGYTLSQDDIENAQMTAEGLVDLMNALPSTDGLWQRVTGFKDLDGFSASMPILAAALIAYAKEISKFNTEVGGNIGEGSAPANALTVANQINEFSKGLDDSGGLVQKLKGWKDLGNFSANLKEFGVAIHDFVVDTTIIQENDPTKTAVSAMKEIKDFIGELGETGGLWNKISDFFGGSQTETITTLTTNMKNIGQAFSIFGSGVKRANKESVTRMQTVFNAIVAWINGPFFQEGDYKEKVKETKKWMSTISTIAGGMSDFGRAMSLMNGAAAGAEKSLNNFQYVTDLFDQFVDYTDQIYAWDKAKEDGTGLDIDSRLGHMTSILQVLESYAGSLRAFNNVAYDTDPEVVEAFSGAIKNMIEGAAAANGQTVTNVQNLQAFLNQLSHLIIPEFDTEGAAAAEAYITSLTIGIQNGTSAMAVASGYAAEGAAEGAATPYSIWYATGVNLATGLKLGIESMTSAIRTAAITAASGAIKAIQVTWSVHSPSRVAQKLGMNFDLGLAKGLSGYAKNVTGEADNISKSVVESAKTLLRGADESLFDGIDPNPTIRPVIDLSNVENGVKSMNGLFAANPTIGTGMLSANAFAMRARTLQFEGARLAGSLDNVDVVNELQSLRDHVDFLNDAITNMQIVMDSGALVGSTSVKMDGQLGTLAMRRSRGN